MARASRKPDRPEALFVLGMHRSGTSALTRVVSLLGWDLPDDLAPPVENDNPTGFWEPKEVIRVNEDILARVGSHWIDSRAPRLELLSQEDEHRVTSNARAFLKAALATGRNRLVIKDPRLSVTLPVWLTAAGHLRIRVSALIALRRPDECAASLSARNALPPEIGMAAWLRYQLEAERATRGLPRAVVRYDELLSDWRSAVTFALSRTGHGPPTAGVKAERAAASFLQADLRHHRFVYPIGDPILAEAHDLFSQDVDAPEIRKRLDALRADFNAAERFYGGHARGYPLMAKALKMKSARIAKLGGS